MNKLIINPIKSIQGKVFIPGSKSISNRVLFLSSLSFKNKTEIINLLDSDDTNYMISILMSLGIKIIKISDLSESYYVYGISDLNKIINKENNILYAGNAGTVFRSILCLLSLCEKQNVTLTGDKRMKERPIKDLVDSLMQGGAKISYLEKNGFPPVKIYGGFVGGNITINSSISSQFLSSLLMICPLAKNNSIISVSSEIVSKPYIDITLKLIKKFKVNINNFKYKKFYIEGNQKYFSPEVIRIESDASSASYFLSAGAIKGSLQVIGVGKKSIQGDIKFANILNSIGANIKFNDFFIESSNNGYFKSIDIDANEIPDSAMTLAITSLYTNSFNKSIIRNIYNWRVKETDRLYAMSNELKKIGATIYEGKDYISIIPPKKFKNATIDTYNDHRIAMCFSLIPLFGVSITIINPECVNKTFPNYFKYLFKISKF